MSLINRLSNCSAHYVRCSILSSTLPIITLARTFNIYHYDTKRQRLIKQREKSRGFSRELMEKERVRLEELAKNPPTGEPHMLHLVYLVKPTKGRPWWEKQIIEKLELEGKLHQPVILKNTPNNNKMLNEVRHLLRIVPLKFLNGLPEHKSDFEHTRITTNGEMTIVKRLKEYEPEPIENDPAKSKWILDEETVKKDLDRKLLDYDVHSEYHKAQYVYKKNQDGKEYRYANSKLTPKYEW